MTPAVLGTSNDQARSQQQKISVHSTLELCWPLLTGLLTAAGAVWFGAWLNPDPLTLPSAALLPRVDLFENQRVSLTASGYLVAADLETYKDELFAWLMFDYLRHRTPPGVTLRLAFDRHRVDAPYTITAVGGPDQVSAVSNVTTAANLIRHPVLRLGLVPESRVVTLTQQTQLFDSAYSMPVRRKLEELPPPAISRWLREFIRFKSATDPRIRRSIEPVPKALSRSAAQHLAGDILTIAEFYSLPLDFFMGIGAMENNYMNVRGDLKHTIWKRRAAPDDIVVEHRGGRVRVLNDSAGVWQITRETLRHAHRLIRNDGRDYNTLPPHLRPPEQLRMNELEPSVLTTYAGMLLRDLLDQFHGDVNLAVSAYNGGPARPNLRYGEGVARAAAHVRKVVEQAAVLNGESVVHMTWLRRPSTSR